MSSNHAGLLSNLSRNLCYQLSALVNGKKYQADGVTIRPCPYGCAYGAGQCINKTSYICGGEGVYPSSGVWCGLAVFV